MKEITAVFVHLGGKVPRYLKKNLIRHLSVFPKVPLLVICDNPDVAKTIESLGVSTYLRSSSFEYVTRQAFGYSPKFRNGFWDSTFNRLIAVSEWLLLNPSTKVLHIESDVILTADFPWASLTREHNALWFEVNEDHDCAALLFLPDAGAADWLMVELGKAIALDPSLTDMTALSVVRARGDARVRLFPTLREESFDLIDTGHFEGVFDAATLGMYVLGRNPRNFYGITQLRKPTPEHFVDPLKFEFESSGEGLIRVSNKFGSTKVFNLHVHSKSSKVFSKSGNKYIANMLEKANDHKPGWQFSLDGFLGWVLDFSQSVFNSSLIPNLRRRFLKRRNF